MAAAISLEKQRKVGAMLADGAWHPVAEIARETGIGAGTLDVLSHMEKNGSVESEFKRGQCQYRDPVAKVRLKPAEPEVLVERKKPGPIPKANPAAKPKPKPKPAQIVQAAQPHAAGLEEDDTVAVPFLAVAANAHERPALEYPVKIGGFSDGTFEISRDNGRWKMTLTREQMLAVVDFVQKFIGMETA